MLRKCSAVAQQLLSSCSAVAQHMLSSCSANAQQILSKCSANAQQMLSKSSAVAKQMLSRCSRSTRCIWTRSSRTLALLMRSARGGAPTDHLAEMMIFGVSGGLQLTLLRKWRFLVSRGYCFAGINKNITNTNFSSLLRSWFTLGVGSPILLSGPDPGPRSLTSLIRIIAQDYRSMPKPIWNTKDFFL